MKPIERELPIFVTGHRGLVGAAVVRRFERAGFAKILVVSSHELDLRDPLAVDAWFAENRPAYVVHCAGRVGGILANSTAPADFLHDNALMALTVLKASHAHRVKKLLYLGSSCIYPRDCHQPIQENALLTGPLETTNDGYAVAKIAGVVACDAYRRQYGCSFISAMPTNLYGPGDNFDPHDSHVIPGLMRRFHEAAERGDSVISVWGTGTPEREFLHVDDLADACLFLMDHYDEAGPINVGNGEEISILELARMMRDLIAPDCDLSFDSSKPDGTPRKVLDVAKMAALGWRASTRLREGLQATYAWFRENPDGLRREARTSMVASP